MRQERCHRLQPPHCKMRSRAGAVAVIALEVVGALLRGYEQMNDGPPCYWSEQILGMTGPQAHVLHWQERILTVWNPSYCLSALTNRFGMHVQVGRDEPMECSLQLDIVGMIALRQGIEVTLLQRRFTVLCRPLLLATGVADEHYSNRVH